MHQGAISYLTIDFVMDFSHAVLVDTYPGFVLRSVLGWQLRRMHCVMRDSQCDSCPFARTCAYAFIFESIIEKTTTSLQGRDRASHPFRLWTDAIPGSITKQIIFHITLFGHAMDYLPHVVYAFRESALAGLFKARIPAVLSSVKVLNNEIIKGDHLFLQDLPSQLLSLVCSQNGLEERKLTIRCLTPLRFKTDGHYSIEFSGAAFLSSCLRRTFSMLEQYGDLDSEVQESLIEALRLCHESEAIQVSERSLRWVEYSHYSGRQKEVMMIGGMMGCFQLEGMASHITWQALDLCKVLGAGKSCSFGYGNVNIQNQQ